MAPALRTFGRILARHCPALAAWYLGGEAAHQLLVQLAGFVGGQTTLGGLLLLPLAVAVRLVSYVAMYLAVRPSLPHSAPEAPVGPRAFGAAVLAAILPFFAFYAAWGMLEADQIEFFRIASDIALREAGFDYDLLGDRGGIVSVGVLPVTVLVIALAARMLLTRLRERLPSWTLALAAYAEVLWTFMLFTLVAQWWADARGWLSGRAGIVWLDDLGDWFAANILPVAVIWEGLLWVVGLVAAVVLVPAAWLTVAGVVYGTTFDATPKPLRGAESALRGTASTLARSVLLRFESLWAAVALVWRGGPVLFGATALAYALWAWAERAGSRGLLQVIGGHETTFWAAFLPLISVAVAVIAEPLRVAIVATAYDAVVGRPSAGLEARTAEATLDLKPGSGSGSGSGSGLDGEARDLAVVAGDVEPERPLGIGGQQKDREDPVGA